MVHNFHILGQTTAGKRLQNEQRKRRSENLQRDQIALEILKTKNTESKTEENNKEDKTTEDSTDKKD